LPLVASGDVHMHVRRRRALHDVMTAIRHDCTVAEAGHALFPNGERHLRRIEDLQTLYPRELLAETLRIAALCTFDLRKLDYRYPSEVVEPGFTAIEQLRQRTWKGAGEIWPGGVPGPVREQVEKELVLIEEKQYEHFFLTVEDIVRWARTRSPPILCQGRGSSANSAVCYCLRITAVTPENGNLLFERFLSKERDEPPDIDVDFEHERREEVIQYVFGKYGRERAALAATVIRYRGKSAVRDVGRALGIPDDQLDVLTGLFSRIRSGQPLEACLRERGFDPSSRTLRHLFALAAELRGFPRHLSQHVGGFVISETPLHELVPVENAAMPERTIIQWDKDDLEEMRLLKVDVLALGMLTCIRKCLDLLHAHALWTLPSHGDKPSLHDIPPPGDEDDAASKPVFDMICKADTIGVFQIESRAQMSMLPRLQPRNFYDLVVQIAIVRPGPIQGDMVHPYLRRRKGHEAVVYPQSRFERESGQKFRRRDSARTHARRADLPGTGHEADPGRRRFQRRTCRPVASCDGRLGAWWRSRTVPQRHPQRHARTRLRRSVFRTHLRADQGLRRIRLSRIALGELRDPRLGLVVAQMLPSRRIHLRAAELATDGFLPTFAADPGRAPPRRACWRPTCARAIGIARSNGCPANRRSRSTESRRARSRCASA
jgi:error-prone DNA polymerase